ncbi:MAG: hypothetical protein QOI41_4922 [Myxococcales bacterium]|nr:hypothetical protein [Myxococcales bacterium]
MIGRCAGAALTTCVLIVATATVARAEGRRRFEPTDLRLQPAGVVEIDLQGGPVTGEDGTRAFAPDFETSIGIGSHVELEIDGTFGFDDSAKPIFLDNTLVAVRIAMFDEPDEPGSKAAWSGGIQAGPRLPTLPQRRLLGFEGLAIVGRSTGRMHVFFQAGSIVDPLEPVPGRSRLQRPVGIESGVNFDLDLDEAGVWSLTGEVGAIKYLSPQLDQLHIAGGPQLQVTPWLDVSLVGLVGLLPGGDRLGLFLGADTRFKMF